MTTTNMPFRIAIADDHTLFAQSLANLIDDDPAFEICFSFSSGNNLLELIHMHQPNILILDINLPPWNGLELIGPIREIVPAIKILFVSMYQPNELKLTPQNFTADGYLLKTSGKELFENALHTIAFTKEKYFSADIHWYKEKEVPSKESFILTRREKEIIQMIKEGHTSREIATKLCISEHTVKTHRAHIREKMNVSGVAQLIQKFNEPEG